VKGGAAVERVWIELALKEDPESKGQKKESPASVKGGGHLMKIKEGLLSLLGKEGGLFKKEKGGGSNTLKVRSKNRSCLCARERKKKKKGGVAHEKGGGKKEASVCYKEKKQSLTSPTRGRGKKKKKHRKKGEKRKKRKAVILSVGRGEKTGSSKRERKKAFSRRKRREKDLPLQGAGRKEM